VKVARLHGPGDVRIGDEPDPVPAAGESLVRVTAVGICGSDLHWYDEGAIGTAILDAPLVLGHEFGGVVVEGPGAGDRVAVDPAVPCGSCSLCARGDGNLCPQVRFAGHGSDDGALRELVAWPTWRLHRVPDTLSDPEVALLEPLGVAIHALDLGHVPPGADVGVVGCGPIGLLLIQALRVAGAGRVVAVEPLPHRRAAATAAGATVVMSPEDAVATRDAGDPDGLSGVDVGFDVSGTDGAVDEVVRWTRPGGRVVMVGIPPGDSTTLTAATVRRKGLTLAWSRRMGEVYPRAIELATGGGVDLASLISARYPLAAAAEALRDAAKRSGLKVIVAP